jgi:hypothetical protein
MLLYSSRKERPPAFISVSSQNYIHIQVYSRESLDRTYSGPAGTHGNQSATEYYFTKNEPATSFGTNQPGPSLAELINAG